MNKHVMVSVLCTAFHHEAYIADALESFVSQETDFAFEVLVNDDCSTDSTAAIIRRYAEEYPQIIRPFLQEKNLFSQGINIYDEVFYPAMQGKYIALCEGDDFWTNPHKLQQQVDFLESHPDYSACVHNTSIHYCDDSAPDKAYVPAEGDRDIPFSQVVRGMGQSFHTSSILCRREYLLNLPDFEKVAFRHGFTDYPIALWLSMNGRIRFLEGFWSTYRVASNAGSWSHGVGKNYERFKRFLLGEIAMFEALLPHLNEEQLPHAQQELLARRFELLYIEGKVEELVKPPYRAIYKSKSFSFRCKQFLKRRLPFLHGMYRKNKGYGD